MPALDVASTTGSVRRTAHDRHTMAATGGMPPRYRVAGSSGPALLLDPIPAPLRLRAAPAVLTAAGRTFPVSRFFLEDVYEATGGLAVSQGARGGRGTASQVCCQVVQLRARRHRLLHHASQSLLFAPACEYVAHAEAIQRTSPCCPSGYVLSSDAPAAHRRSGPTAAHTYARQAGGSRWELGLGPGARGGTIRILLRRPGRLR